MADSNLSLAESKYFLRPVNGTGDVRKPDPTGIIQHKALAEHSFKKPQVYTPASVKQYEHHTKMS